MWLFNIFYPSTDKLYQLCRAYFRSETLGAGWIKTPMPPKAYVAEPTLVQISFDERQTYARSFWNRTATRYKQKKLRKKTCLPETK